MHEIRLLSEIAKTNGSLISLQEAATLTTGLTERQLEAVWAATPALSAHYELRDGFVVERGQGPLGGQMLLQREGQRRARAERFLRHAREFASFWNGNGATFIGISGSTSYQTASETDDLDFFCVTKPNHLWMFLTKSLLLSRLYHLAKKGAPRICFSYVVDEEFAEREFESPKDALFARDALTTIVVHGEDYYKRLLARGSWISNYFPQRYGDRSSPSHKKPDLTMRATTSPLDRFLNLTLFFLVSNYVKIKSAILNRKFRKQGKLSSIFTVKAGPSHCIFESMRYSVLRSMYHGLDKTLETR